MLIRPISALVCFGSGATATKVCASSRSILDFGSGEILYLKWEEVELESGIIKMPVRKNRRMLDAPLTVAGAEKALPERGLN